MQQWLSRYTRNPRDAACLLYLMLAFPPLLSIAAANPEILPLSAGCMLAPVILGRVLQHRHPTASRVYAAYMAVAIAVVAAARLS